MKETGLTGKRRSTTIAATPDDGKSQRKRRDFNRDRSDGKLTVPWLLLMASPENSGLSKSCRLLINAFE